MTKLAEDNAKKGKLHVAVEDYKSALALDPNHVEHNMYLHLGLCKLLVKLGRGKDAINAILGVSKTSTISEIKRAYKKLDLQWHQDKNVDNTEEAENKFRDIAATYEILGDDDKRARYDHGEDIEVCNWLTFKSMVVMVFDF